MLNIKKGLFQRYLPMDNVERSKKASFVRRLPLKSSCFVSKKAKSQIEQSFSQKSRFRFWSQMEVVLRCIRSTLFSNMTPFLIHDSRLANSWRDRNYEKEKTQPGGDTY